MSKKRKQTQNRRKAKKAKEARREADCQRVVEIIAPQHPVNNVTEPIGPLFLHFEGIRYSRHKNPMSNLLLTKDYLQKNPKISSNNIYASILINMMMMMK